MKNKHRPLLIAIVGGSGAGKTWLAEKLRAALAGNSIYFSLDNFYRDRSRLSPTRRARLNFDHPRAIDWPRVERALQCLLRGEAARIPAYDFATHSRLAREIVVPASPVVILDGLWLLRRKTLRGLFDLKIFIECPAPTRLQRRLARDLVSRGRTSASVRRQFRRTVEPMHARFVAPQRHWADVVLPSDFDVKEVRQLAEAIDLAVRERRHASPRPARFAPAPGGVARETQPVITRPSKSLL